MAAGDLTSIANVEQWLNLQSGCTDEALLVRLITAASGFIRTWCDRDFVSQSYTDTLDGKGAARMPLPNTPITAVASLAIDGNVIPPGDPVSTPGYFFTSTMLCLNGYRFSRGMANVVVSYTAGFATVPPELEQACIELVAFRYRELDRIGVASKGMAGETTSFTIKDVPPSVRTILEQKKKVVPA
jgi:hypothetical protein